MFLFVTIPNNSGSTLVHSILATSPAVSTLKKEIWFDRPNPKTSWCEGRDVRLADRSDYVSNYMPAVDLRCFTEYEYENYNWEMIQKFWLKSWDMTKPVQVEKTPDNVMKAIPYSEHFEPSKFIVAMRSPYAFCDSMTKYKLTVERSSRHWELCAQKQIENIDALGNRCYWTTYENICKNPDGFSTDLIAFEPDLVSLDRLDIRNLNETIRLSDDDFETINQNLSAETMKFFGYEKIKQLR
jgi:hypothetical protein